MTYSTKDKEMFNTNKAVQVYFNGTVVAVVVNSTPGAVASPATTKTSITYADIYIPFPVRPTFSTRNITGFVFTVTLKPTKLKSMSKK